MDETKKNTKHFYILIIAAVLVFALVCTGVISAVLMIAPLFSGKQIANTASLLFFDITDINSALDSDAIAIDYSLLAPSETDGMLSVSVKTNSNNDRSHGNGIINLSRGEEELSVKFIYDSENAAIAGIFPDPDEYVSLPRTNIKESFDSSLFAPGSNSIHTMSISSYNRLVPLLESTFSPDAGKDDSLKAALSDLSRDITKKLTPLTSFGFSGGELCLNITYILEPNDIKSILRTVADALDKNPDLRAYSKAFGTTAADGTNMSLADTLRALCDTDAFAQTVISCTQNSKYITSFDVSSADTKISAKLIEDGNTVGFDLTVDGAALSYRKNLSDSTYTITEGGNLMASGTIRGGDSILFTLCADETQLISLSLEKRSAVTDTLPAHRPLLGMSKDELTEYFRNIPIKKLNSLLDGFGIDLSPYITADGKMLLHADKLVDESERHYAEYISLLKTTEKDMIESVSKLYIWNDRLEAYILFTYYAENDSLMLGCAYELSDEVRENYHVARVDGGLMFVHSFECLEKIEPDCENDGKEVWKCEFCDYSYEVKLPSPGHKYEFLTKAAYRHDGSFNTASCKVCSVCENIELVIVDYYCTYWLKKNGDGSYNVTKYEQQSVSTWENFYVPIPDDIELEITEIRVNLEKSVKTAAFPEGIRKIGASSFRLPSIFETLYLPSTLEIIEPGAFYGGGKPSKIVYAGTKEEWEKVEKGEYTELWKDVEIVFEGKTKQ